MRISPRSLWSQSKSSLTRTSSTTAIWAVIIQFNRVRLLSGAAVVVGPRQPLGWLKLVVGSLFSIGVWVFEPVAGLITLSELVRQDLAVGGVANLEADEVGMADALGTHSSVNARFTL